MKIQTRSWEVRRSIHLSEGTMRNHVTVILEINQPRIFVSIYRNHFQSNNSALSAVNCSGLLSREHHRTTWDVLTATHLIHRCSIRMTQSLSVLRSEITEAEIPPSLLGVGGGCPRSCFKEGEVVDCHPRSRYTAIRTQMHKEIGVRWVQRNCTSIHSHPARFSPWSLDHTARPTLVISGPRP